MLIMCHTYATQNTTKFYIITYIAKLFYYEIINNNKGLHMIIYYSTYTISEIIK